MIGPMRQGQEVGASAPTIRAINDAFRRDLLGGTVVVTPSVAALPEDQKCQLLDRVRAFDAFDAGNDPWGEHDFGSIELEGDIYFWKIDAYDLSLQAHSPDATDPDVTRRVLTVMRADEY